MREADATKLVKIHANFIIIRNNGEEYNDTLENFQTDAGEAPPAISPGMLGRSYIPGEKHRETNGSKAFQLPMPWSEGDALLGRVSELVAAQEARRDLPGNEEDSLVVKRINALDALLVRKAAEPGASAAEKEFLDALRGKP